MKKTLLFSNLKGDISSLNSEIECEFYSDMAKVLKKNISNFSTFVYISATDNDEETDIRYYNTMINCFKKIDINFKGTIRLSSSSEKYTPRENSIYFLMGGNPYEQMKIIKKLKLTNILKNTKDLVIGFCSGAINLSEVSIITTDEDFKTLDSYIGIQRITLTIEPHFNIENSTARVEELKVLSAEHNIDIYAISDSACIYINKETEFYGEIYLLQDNEFTKI